MIDSKQNPMCETLGDPLVCGRGGGGGGAVEGKGSTSFQKCININLKCYFRHREEADFISVNCSVSNIQNICWKKGIVSSTQQNTSLDSMPD